MVVIIMHQMNIVYLSIALPPTGEEVGDFKVIFLHTIRLVYIILCYISLSQYQSAMEDFSLSNLYNEYYVIFFHKHFVVKW